MKPRSFSDLYREAERHQDYWVAGAILEFTESVVREMARQRLTRKALAKRLGATPAYVTRILRGEVNFTLATMMWSRPRRSVSRSWELFLRDMLKAPGCGSPA